MDQKYLQEILDYNPDTGDLTWKVSPRYRVNIGDVAGCFDAKGYRVIRHKRTHWLAHRLVWLYVHGYLPKEIDHINGDPGDNRIENLRAVSHATNQRNCKRQINNTSGVSGVFWEPRHCHWYVKLVHQGIQKYFGSYHDWFDAVCAVKAAQNACGYHANHGRIQS